VSDELDSSIKKSALKKKSTMDNLNGTVGDKNLSPAPS